MFSKRLVVLVAALWTVTAMQNGFAAEGSSGLFTRVNIDIPADLTRPVRNKIIAQLTGLPGKRFVYLDLSVAFSTDDGKAQPFTAIVDGEPGRKTGCSFEALPMGSRVRYELGPLADYNHLLMSVLTGDRSAFPYNDVACEYGGSGRESRFHIRGFFYVLANSIPTAVSLQLRPLAPPLEVARQVLSR